MSTKGRQFPTLSLIFPLLPSRVSFTSVWEADRQHHLIVELGVVVMVIRETKVEGV